VFLDGRFSADEIRLNFGVGHLGKRINLSRLKRL